ncbi:MULTISPECIES: 3'-5' exonuclease [Marinobacter]|jgi:DNA polymerase-3 subunit epsilon|uniref:3'-5' exonuclease n=1 Tax=Marinobacter TaxID=2742 RepID=UPI00200361DD|nr:MULTISPECIES: 3'-5' exonuclease [Marinobacter]MCK7552561.1 3'-5' exonuclease [Marinobacter goseongensis]MDV3504396.1 3'-5' exonuclease [Marinobacter sp. M-5]
MSELGDTRKTHWPDELAQLEEQARDGRLQTFYQAGCVAPETAIAEAPLVALDFETTGLDPDKHSIVSIGLVPFTLAGIQLGMGRHWVVRPQLPLHQTSITIHGITHTDIDQAPDLNDVLNEVLEAMAGRIAVVHYRSIERKFFNVAMQWRLGEGIHFPLIDTMAIEAHLHPDRIPTRWQKLTGKKPVSIRLADSRQRYGLPHYAAHNALIDAIATAELLQAQVLHHFGPQTPVSDLWL